MCYDFKFELLLLIKVCKFSEFQRPFQVINYLFFKEVYNLNSYSGLHKKKKPLKNQRLFQYFVRLWELNPLKSYITFLQLHNFYHPMAQSHIQNSMRFSHPKGFRNKVR